MDLFGVKIVRFKRRLEAGSLTLRVCRLRDLAAFYSRWTPEIFPAAVSENRPRSLFSFYRWLKRTFQAIYLIEVEENGERRMVGFAGLYHMDLGRSLSVSLAVFHPEDRRRGYGERALTLLLGLIQENGAAEAVYAEIFKNNVPSLRLCLKLGFKVKKLHQDRFLLEKNEKTKSEEGQR